MMIGITQLTNERMRLARAFRAVPGLATRITFDHALEDQTLMRLLQRIADTQDKPRKRKWAQYFR